MGELLCSQCGFRCKKFSEMGDHIWEEHIVDKGSKEESKKVEDNE